MRSYAIFIVFTSYLFNKKMVMFATVLSLGSIGLVYILEQAGLLHPAKYSNESQFQVILVLLPTLGFLTWIVIDNWEYIIKNLTDTYDMTLSGWGQALEYRDRETQGHSQRVATLTIALAKRLGISAREQDHIRRGVLLHDIGKIAVPDAILLKVGSLSDEDWEIVKKHPLYARNMLEGIPFLKPALDIPYSHHERWDGSGYPEGLSGEAIPLAARIFAVVDVWDALTSDRPYRQAWPEERTRDYLREQSGKQFDPQIVKVFLQLIGNDQNTRGV